MAEQLTDPFIIVNSEKIAIVPGSLSYTPGFGERQALAQSEGGGRVSQVMSTNQATAFSKVNFALRMTTDNEARVRRWMTLRNRNSIEIAITDDEGNRLTRTFTQALVMGDPTHAFGYDTQIDIEWNANQSR